ncbi:S-ribosylhomocysteine lyase [Pseudodesulfovibrio tunisiensis]|uniref:S-ribosylhomocysteine lyase n=1 Tax=Pseudodesulfovibrio tunisiensis TaxID=463192 RepID=UPI001FB427A4|nr:S-ribosylhomocysteine lyase [Pseudodesulfovibrio tunisiensis]
MKRIASFQIDHTKLKRGVYVSRKDTLGNATVTTFDIRMKEPNNEPALSSAAAHAIEHLAATFLRNHSEYGQKIVYFGPMGCMTGFYLLLGSDHESEEIVPLLRQLFRFMADFEGKIPGASPVECGNCTFMDLAKAKHEADKYLREVLTDIQNENLTYPA